MPPRRRGIATRQIPTESGGQIVEMERSVPIRRRARQVDDEIASSHYPYPIKSVLFYLLSCTHTKQDNSRKTPVRNNLSIINSNFTESNPEVCSNRYKDFELNLIYNKDLCFLRNFQHNRYNKPLTGFKSLDWSLLHKPTTGSQIPKAGQPDDWRHH
ncbi:hypothetical protein F511_03914 [Dorcoceras hygrometricum]|uniref:Uncharacterized protein n=1 Tax=Dorcoceras hygrometricum TaxID=472368 RepID=A0A2Z7C0Q8_9LAMI|nr:hypothetical protein F511_03914 [Dorcoceras hygrometricum]